MIAHNLDEYFERYGAILGRQAALSMRPVHVPHCDPVLTPELCRRPYSAQEHVIEAGAKVIDRQRSVLLIAEMGSGKTFMGAAIAHRHASGRSYRAIVMCPGQLCGKWEREIYDTIPGATVKQIRTWKDILSIHKGSRRSRRKVNSERSAYIPANGPMWYIIPRDRAKLGCGWRAAYSARRAMGEHCIRCPSCGRVQLEKSGVPLTPDEFSRRKMACQHAECKERLWQCVGKPWRWEPARYIQKRMRRFFDYLILDEVHETKCATSEQGNAAGALAAASRKVVAMTGTLIGGRADHIHPLLMRLCPRQLVSEGLGWHNVMAFNAKYGRIETKTVERRGGARDVEDAAYGRGKKKTTTKKVCPGIMPTLFGRHLIGNAIFLRLSEVASGLPDFEEQVCGVNMSLEQAEAYKHLEQKLVQAVKILLRRGNRAMLVTMLHTLLQYPDHPFGWGQVGYNERSPSGEQVFVPVVWPSNLPDGRYPKELKLLEIIKNERSLGRQCWVYVQYNGERDCLSRLERILSDSGLNALALRSSVDVSSREDWIGSNAAGADVVLSHPRLVETGLDLFSREGAYNFPTIIFYQTGYNLFTLRQASRRAWRIGQVASCKSIYLYYSGTIQEKAMILMGSKMAAARALDGEFSSDGLVSMAGEDGSAEMELAKAIAERIGDGEAERRWKSGR